MGSSLPSCWEIKKCGREEGGVKVAELGECIASVKGMPHSCWEIAGTLCGGVVQGTAAQKEGNCLLCLVYVEYNRMSGAKKDEVRQDFPDEEERYKKMLTCQLKRVHETLCK